MHLDIPDVDFAGTIFDLDGTLIDSMPIHYRAWDAAMRRVGLSHPLDEDYFYALGGVPTRRVAQLFGERYQIPVDPDHLADSKEKLYLELLADVQCIEPVVAFARDVSARQPVAIVTGGTPEVVFPSLEASDLRSLFNIVITPLDVPVGRGKPEPDMFLLAARRMGVPPERCLVFEDAEPGMAGARAAGMTVVKVPSRGLSR